MRYTVETVGGDELHVRETLAAATRAAVERLQDDPELGELYVCEVGRKAPAGTYLKTITTAPDQNWDAHVVVLDYGEKIQPPSAFICRPEDIDESGGYALTDPKHERHHEVMSDVWDAREGK